MRKGENCSEEREIEGGKETRERKSRRERSKIQIIDARTRGKTDDGKKEQKQQANRHNPTINKISADFLI